MPSNNNFAFVSKWYAFGDIVDLEERLCLGDRLEFDRNGLYAHWGIYVGRYKWMEHAVVHFGIFEGGAAFSKKKTSGSASSASQKPEILADAIGRILDGDKVRINNSRDNQVEPLDPDDLIEEAKKMHRDKTPIDYRLLSSNCEHFVNLCRYNRPHSEQIPPGVEMILNIWNFLRYNIPHSVQISRGVEMVLNIWNFFRYNIPDREQVSPIAKLVLIEAALVVFAVKISPDA
ncbi:phospholipase A and acyltransferase 4-like [Patiria miniata]|uniref:LRAT domain-containing protein n=1 Tax=Patiria miniata TaxID=46514 RepID=A0A914AF16_PATMI|nr:phospholipase A and acyltransferase 4-like [Patiria miniata]